MSHAATRKTLLFCGIASSLLYAAMIWAIMAQPFPFKTPEGEARFLAAYDAVLKRWPVPFDELDIPTRFGMTHVVAAGPKNAPALVLLHGYMATSVMWAPNIADFSQDYRVYAIDVMGQPSKSMPDQPVRDAADYVAWLTRRCACSRFPREERRPAARDGTAFGGVMHRSQMTQGDIMLRHAHAELAL